MRLGPPPQINVVRKEEKEARLTTFIDQDLGHRKLTASAGHTYLLIARSLDSPSARALLAAAPQAATLGIRYRILLMLDEATTRDLAPTAGDHLAAMETRIGTDMRLLDAHEFLVLGPTTVWIGDCMRRDPSKRDAYEFYSSDAAEASRSAARSFERLWQVASPLLLRRITGTIPDAVAIMAEAAPTGLPGSVEAGTRH